MIYIDSNTGKKEKGKLIISNWKTADGEIQFNHVTQCFLWAGEIANNVRGVFRLLARNEHLTTDQENQFIIDFLDNSGAGKSNLFEN